MLTLLTIVFAVLKATHNINWSWFDVLLPFFVECLVVLPFIVVQYSTQFNKVVGSSLASTVDFVMGRK